MMQLKEDQYFISLSNERNIEIEAPYIYFKCSLHFENYFNSIRCFNIIRELTFHL